MEWRQIFNHLNQARSTMRYNPGRTLSGMQPHPLFDRKFLLLIVIGVVSILGFGWFFSTSNFGEAFIIPTAIPSSYSSPTGVTPTPSPLATTTLDETHPIATGTSPNVSPEAPTEPLISTNTQITENLSIPSATYTPKQFQPLPAGKYDDTNPNIAYDMFWTLLRNSGTGMCQWFETTGMKD